MKEVTSRYAEALYSLKRDSNSLEKTQEANEEYQTALKLDSEDETTLNNYGNFLLQNGEPESAKKYFIKAIELNPDFNLYKENLYQSTKMSTKYYKLKTKYKNKFLKPIMDKKGYLNVGLSKNNQRKAFKIHRLVALHFIPNIENKPEIDHINTIKTDNTVFLNEDGSINYEKTNLRWTTRKENINNPLTKTKMRINARKPSKGKYGKKHHRSKPIIQYDKDGNFIREWDCANDVERVLGISNKHIGSVCLGKRKSCGGYIWKYKNAA